MSDQLSLWGASEHNLKNLDVSFPHQKISVVTGVSGSGKSSLVFDTILSEAQRRFFYTLSHYSRQFLHTSSKPSYVKIEGLCPASGLAQYEKRPSSRASVGTFTDISELLGVLFARFGTGYCPDHQISVAMLTSEELANSILKSDLSKLLVICSPVCKNRKGAFQKKLASLEAKGYLRVLIDGQIQSLSPLPKLDPEKKHTIYLVVDLIKINLKTQDRLLRSLEKASEESGGFIETLEAISPNKFLVEKLKGYSLKGGCPVCQFSFPRLDSRYFSANSLGKCSECHGMGFEKKESPGERGKSSYQYEDICIACDGTGLNNISKNFRLGSYSFQDLQQVTMQDLREILENDINNHPAFKRISEEVVGKIKTIESLELSYLSLARRIKSLSGGEYQRLKLSSLPGDHLRGVMYILDEPGQGLHTSELKKIMNRLKYLRDQGNTIIVIDHHQEIIRQADLIIELGPAGGALGGSIVAKFNPADAHLHTHISDTARYLTSNRSVHKKPATAGKKEYITVENASKFNLKIDHLKLLKNGFNVIFGVSGSGKSTLLSQTLFPYIKYNFIDQSHKNLVIKGFQNFEYIELIDRSPLSKSGSGMVATILDVFSFIRKLFEKIPDAQIMGLSSRDFSLHVAGGRCEECSGKGVLTLKMKFLDDATIRCGECSGKRYQPRVLDILYKSRSIADILSMTIDESLDFFHAFPKFTSKLKTASELGLGYLNLGQPGSGLSGGESQRLKLAAWTGSKKGENRLILIEEPSRGLHFTDIQRLIKVFTQFVADGGTLIITEHHPDLISQADWLVGLGPGAATAGGNVIWEGEPSQEYLKQLFSFA